MPLVLLAVFYVVAFWLLRTLAPLAESQPGGLLVLAQVLGGVAALFGPLAITATIDSWLDRRAVMKVALARCATLREEFVRLELHKNHYSLISLRDGVKQLHKFRVRFDLGT